MAELLAGQTLVVNRNGEKAKAGDFLKGKGPFSL
jgi:hypothetical protein